MIVLDTNVLSALMQGEPDPLVVAWLDGCPPESVWTTSVTIFEIHSGLELLGATRRRRVLEEAFTRTLAEDLQGRVLPFDEPAALAAAALAARRRKQGRPVDFRDTQVAGVIMVRRATLATRNVRPFRDLAVEVINPWSAG